MTLTTRTVLIMMLLLLPVRSFAAETLKLVQPILTDDKDGMMKNPQGIVCAGDGSFIVADSANGRLLTYTFKDDIVKGGKEIKVPQMSYPLRLQMNSKDEIFVFDGKLRRILRLSPQGAFLGYLDIQGLPAGPSPVIRSFKIDDHDAIYVLDIFGERVIVLDPAGKYQKQIAFPPDHGFISDLAVGTGGTIYLIDSTRTMVDVAAKDAAAFTPLTKSLKGDMDFPTYITTDSKGTIYVVDQDGGGIVVLGQDGSYRTRMLSMGWKGGLVRYPGQICLNGKGNFFVADRDNNRVQIFEQVK